MDFEAGFAARIRVPADFDLCLRAEGTQVRGRLELGLRSRHAGGSLSRYGTIEVLSHEKRNCR
jgi:hypothetical protein